MKRSQTTLALLASALLFVAMMLSGALQEWFATGAYVCVVALCAVSIINARRNSAE